MSATIEITVPGKDPVVRRLSAEGTTTVGRTVAEGIAVPEARQLEREHFIVEQRVRGCHVMILPGASTDATLKGREFADGLVSWGDILLIGQVQIRFMQNANKGPSPVVILGSVVIVGLLAFIMMQKNNHQTITARMPEAPQLIFNGQPCTEAGDAAMARAIELEEEALASAERYAFDLTDGMDATRLFVSAAACYQQAGDQSAVKRTQQSYKAWEKRLSERYDAHRLRLRVALDRGQSRVAGTQVASLKLFLRDFQEHPYRSWIADVENQLRLEELATR